MQSVGRAPAGIRGILERDDSIAALHDAYSDAQAGTGRLAFVAGEAGVGKTALVRAFCDAVRGSSRILEGACDPLFTPRPLGPFADIATETGGPLAELVEQGATPRDVLAAVRGELRVLSTVVVLEDVHWADEATLDVLRLLGRRIETMPSLVIATYRDEELDSVHPLRIMLGELATARGVARLKLEPLSWAGVRQLADGYAIDVEELYRLTSGNPFYVSEVLEAGGDRIPPTVRDAVLARADRLGTRARRLLETVAVIPPKAELWLLETVVSDELKYLDQCLAAGMLREDRDAVGFRHELARLAVEESIGIQRRRRLHRAIVAALASPSTGKPDHARLAHHAEQAALPEATLEHARAAAQHAAALEAHREAADQYLRALRHADDLAAAERIALLEAYASETQVIGRFPASIETRREAIAICRELGDRRREGDNLSRLVTPCIYAGLNAEAEEASRAAIDVLEELPPGRELGVAYAFQGFMRMLSRDNADGVEWGEKALELAERFDDLDTRAQAMNLIETSHVMAGEIERGCKYLERSLDLSLEHSLEHRVAAAYIMLGSGLGEMYELELAEHWLREHIAFAEEHDLDSSYTRSWLAMAHVYRGRWDEGTELAREVLADDAGVISRITALIALGRVRARRGDPGADDVLDEALELARPGGHLQRLGHVRAARAEAAWLVGDREQMLGEARAAYNLTLEKRHLWFAGELAYWQWKGGALETAPDWIAEPYARQLAGDACGAAAAWVARGCPYEAARALAEDDDEDELRHALDESQRLGARPLATMVARRLRERGAHDVPRGPRPSTRDNPAHLTAREI